MIKGLIFAIILVPTLLFSQDSLHVRLNAMINEWHTDAARADMEAYFGKMAEDGIYIGTDATENWTKQGFYEWSKPYFDKGKAWTFKAVERNIYLSEDRSIAWFDEKLEASYGMLRGSGVLYLNEGGWKIIHYVLSLPVPNEKFQEILKVIADETR